MVGETDPTAPVAGGVSQGVGGIVGERASVRRRDGTVVGTNADVEPREPHNGPAVYDPVDAVERHFGAGHRLTKGSAATEPRHSQSALHLRNR